MDKSLVALGGGMVFLLAFGAIVLAVSVNTERSCDSCPG
uniref:Uncharacterized protein n=1 Tax=viral metagenome TaxID=1070528 RepID=A0A6C0KF90_9ZZZZ